MVIYICEKCNEEFKQKGHYTRHINRKYPCNNNTSLTEIDNKYSNNGINIPKWNI